MYDVSEAAWNWDLDMGCRMANTFILNSDEELRVIEDLHYHIKTKIADCPTAQHLVSHICSINVCCILSPNALVS